MTTIPNRRPLASRNTTWAAAMARGLAARGISPNQISAFGMVMAAAAGGALWGAGSVNGWARALLLILGAAFTQGRLLCNLLDGMVAIEGGRISPDGHVWNEAPDRVSDVLILVGLALGAGVPALGWAAAAAAILTAYVRELGTGCGLPADFTGPMAKPHRMAAVTGAVLLTLLAPLLGWRDEIICAAMWLIFLGAALTALRRAGRLVRELRRRGAAPD